VLVTDELVGLNAIVEVSQVDYEVSNFATTTITGASYLQHPLSTKDTEFNLFQVS